MTLVDAIDEFSHEMSNACSPTCTKADLLALQLFKEQLLRAGNPALDAVPPLLRDFLSLRYVEAAPSIELPPPDDLIRLLSRLFESVATKTGEKVDDKCLPILEELSRTLPAALKIGESLSTHIATHGGAFSFPEFLTTFADGGRSSYDVDAPNGKGAGALESYFRILKVEGSRVELEDLISDERVWPVVFPDQVAQLIEPGYVMNLEIVRVNEEWQIAACGFTYPPGTDLP
jgi:hypothetical protein